MRAVRHHTYGEPDVLTVEDAPEPHAGPGKVRVRVRAASVNAFDWKLRAGWFQERIRLELPAIPGKDAAGVVDEVGEGVTGVLVGDRVFGLGDATFAEHAVLNTWAAAPDAWSDEQAAAAGLAAATAGAGLDALGDLDGRTLLVEGAAGGVGSAAVELAVARGARVIGTASARNHDFLRSLGATPTLYGDGLTERVAALAPEGVDAALDTAGSGSLAEIVAIVGDPSRVATVADFGGARLGVTLTGSDAATAATLEAAAEAGSRGAYTPRVEATFPLDRAAEAHAHAQGGHTRGKLVVTL
ncbi:NADP-dependent oxidoreductase [Cellulomonas cellasea]|uniref:Oxidoreductase n=1 Tax=Cellulomonas cellasea TaxID=43670 RepID=A0A4Y3KW69_9CELL|nr:NADP-dependent oxidoreductase [Cellulomonas cellasea]GEA87160.1 oxidoreductase [Cellulomonas cellasea]